MMIERMNLDIVTPDFVIDNAIIDLRSQLVDGKRQADVDINFPDINNVFYLSNELVIKGASMVLNSDLDVLENLVEIQKKEIERYKSTCVLSRLFNYIFK